MSGSNVHANDAMTRRLETEAREKEAFANGIIEQAQQNGRDLNEHEKKAISDTRERLVEIREQCEYLGGIAHEQAETRKRLAAFSDAMHQMGSAGAGGGAGQIEYRSAGAWIADAYGAAVGEIQCRERLELYMRAADHQKTTDTPGTVPDPIVGQVVNFIDAARPLTTLLGPRPLTNGTWYRPKVTQHTAVARQGTAGALGADEKQELVSQRMRIVRIPATAQTYGGYVNVSRQDIDFSNPSGLDLVVEDLGGEYSIETEAAVGASLATTTATPVSYDLTPTTGTPQDSLSRAIWTAVAQVFTATRGRGQLFIVVAPDVLANFGPLFSPYPWGPPNQLAQGFEANRFGQGIMGTISGVPTAMSAGLASGEAFVGSTAAIEVYEQRIGTLQIMEPSVLGVQVAYAGYFTPLKIEDGGLVPLVSA